MPSLSNIRSRSEAFSASLATHLLLCDWSGENWRWYINDLENQFQKLSGDALAIPVDKPHSPSPPNSPASPAMSPRTQSSSFGPPSRVATFQSSSSPRSKREVFSPTIPSRTTTLMDCSQPARGYEGDCCENDKWIKAGIADVNSLKTRFAALYALIRTAGTGSFWRSKNAKHECTMDEKAVPVSPTSTNKRLPPELPPTFPEDSEEKPHDQFTMSDLQALQYIEDKTQEALLVLRLNSEVLEDLRQHYRYTTDHTDFPTDLRHKCDADLAKFDKCVLGVEKDLRMLQSRTETLLRLLANRKNLLNGILQYRSVKANEFFAKKAQVSADRMEKMTIEMHAVAKKTEQETVSMRVITTVTLFFLPATFIATFMSTDILKFESGKQDFELKGLQVYLAIALPMTALTFFAWFMIYRSAKKAYTSSDQSSGVSNASNMV